MRNNTAFAPRSYVLSWRSLEERELNVVKMIVVKRMVFGIVGVRDGGPTLAEYT
jgi:hypothetical protein